MSEDIDKQITQALALKDIDSHLEHIDHCLDELKESVKWLQRGLLAILAIVGAGHGFPAANELLKVLAASFGGN